MDLVFGNGSDALPVGREFEETYRARAEPSLYGPEVAPARAVQRLFPSWELIHTHEPPCSVEDLLASGYAWFPPDKQHLYVLHQPGVLPAYLAVLLTTWDQVVTDAGPTWCPWEGLDVSVREQLLLDALSDFQAAPDLLALAEATREATRPNPNPDGLCWEGQATRIAAVAEQQARAEGDTDRAEQIRFLMALGSFEEPKSPSTPEPA